MLTVAAHSIARTVAERRLTARCDIASVVDTDGVQTWPPSAGDVACLVGMPRQGGAMAMMDRLGNEPGAIIWLPVEIAIKGGDRITVQETGTTYEVVHAPVVRSDELLRSVVVIETRSPGGSA